MKKIKLKVLKAFKKKEHLPLGDLETKGTTTVGKHLSFNDMGEKQLPSPAKLYVNN